MPLLSLTDTLDQFATRRYVEDTLGSEPWLTVYEHVDAPMFDGTVFTALIPSDHVADALERPRWDLLVGGGAPGFSVGREGTVYDPWNLHGGVRPLVIKRMFHVAIEGVQRFELLEEFRLFHNLAYVARDETYYDVSSTPKPVARWKAGRLEIERKAARQFLAVKGMHLALFFQLNRRSHERIDAVPGSERDVRREGDGWVYELAVRPWDGSSPGRSFSKLIGKRVVPPLPLDESGVWPYGEDDRYEEFIVGVDAAGEPVLHTCDPDELDYAKKPYKTDTVHFRRDVLGRYYGDLSRYSVGRWRLRCGSLWSLELIDDDEEGLVYVALGDLGIIPYDEQQYWRAFNVEPVLGERVATAYGSPEPSHDFRDAYARADVAWNDALGWPLFKPLTADDRHNLDGLRVPLDGGPAEFDGQVLALAKVAIDSLNERPIQGAARAAGFEFGGGEAGIAKLSGLLDATGFEAELHGLDRTPTDWMKEVQWLRSKGSAHRKSSDYAKVAEHLRLEERGRAAAMRGLLVEGTLMLDALAEHVGEVSRCVMR